MDNTTHFDVIIIGAGLSGIGTAHHLQENCPDKTFAILEARAAMGGTWDYFKYPGLRSDSDMYTLGYSFKPWTSGDAIADGPAILDYIKETAREDGTDQHIRYNHRVQKLHWSSEKNQWSLEAALASGEKANYTAQFILNCSGYYSYESGFTPNFEGMENFKGQIVHPQAWTEDVVHAHKKVIVIGSGATAVTLVPELAKTAEHVVMLQRSPTYVINMPKQDNIANALRRFLPEKLSYWLSRWKNILSSLLFYKISRRFPDFMRKLIMGGAKKSLTKEVDVDTHFNPSYKVWDQRVCMVPDNDLFHSLNDKKATIVTDHIDRFTEKGILLKSGKELEADLIVSATGLRMQFLPNIDFKVDGKEMDRSKLMIYRGMMLSDIPNLAIFIGYTNASWTLKTDLSGKYVCRVINELKKQGKARFTPIYTDTGEETDPIVDFNSSYVLRAVEALPKQGKKTPWKLHQNYIKDNFNFKYSKVEDGVLELK